MSAFITAPALPTQTGPEGIRYDFNDGARLWLPPGEWHAQLIDDESGNLLYGADSDGGWIYSTKKYYVAFRIRVWRRGESEPLLDHVLDLADKEVLISFPVGTLGDLMGWFPYAERFREAYGSQVVCTLARNLIELFEPNYPELELLTPDAYGAQREPYATYRIGLFFQGDLNNQPFDFRQVGLHRTAGHILGVDPTEIMPRLSLDAPRAIAEKYVCIATMSTGQAKFWNNGTGWDEVVEFLKSQGYRVLCIDRSPLIGQGFVWNKIPRHAEDYTGDRPLQERVDLLAHAEFFVGLGSGLSWLAWGCRIPVVMISGFSLARCEFDNPWRVINSHVCNGCWDDTKENFDHQDFLWCPRFKGTERQYECTRAITGKQVICTIKRLMAQRATHGAEASLRAVA